MYRDDALDVFAAALGYRRTHPRVTSMGDVIRRHSTRPGFRAVGAFGTGDRLVGFSHGYTSQPGLWWREQVVSHLTPEQRRTWFEDAFELAELHVHPTAQGHRLGSQLHDLLLTDVHQRTAVLSVMDASQRARVLYARRHWQTLIEDMRFSTDPATPFSILGLAL